MLAVKITYFKSFLKETIISTCLDLAQSANFRTVFNSMWFEVDNKTDLRDHPLIVFLEIVNDCDFFIEDWPKRAPNVKFCVLNFNDIKLLFVVKELQKTVKNLVIYLNYYGSKEERKSLLKILIKNKLLIVSDEINLHTAFDFKKILKPRQLTLI